MQSLELSFPSASFNGCFYHFAQAIHNNLEGWHSKIKKIAGKNHLNIFENVELFKKEQASAEVKIRQLMAGGTRRRQAPHRRNKDIRIKAIVGNFDNYTIIDYVTALSYWVGK